jgi:hypothetical protein
MDLRLEGSVNKGHKEERSRSARRTSAAILAACGGVLFRIVHAGFGEAPFLLPFLLT